jgi:outer membrane protein assembly factor BamA
MRRNLLVFVLLLSAASPAVAQQTREESLRQEREAKAGTVQPYKAGRLEKWLLRIENDRILERLFVQSGSNGGFYVRVGRITSGGGFGVGPGYRRRNLFGGQMEFSVSAAASIKKYWVTEGIVAFPHIAEDHAYAEVRVRKREFPQEDFFGPGPDSNRPDRSNFFYRDTGVTGTFGVKPVSWLTVGTRAEYFKPRLARGEDKLFPSVHDLFTVDQAPGLEEQPDFLRYEGFADLNYTNPTGNPRSGGRYLFSINSYDDRTLNRYSFRRYDMDLRQYIPFVRKRRVIALRALVSTSSTDEGNVMPFYLQSTIGGASTLRGFRDFRFRDAHLVLLQGEYRFEMYPALDVALFYDTGKVAARRRDLSLKDLEKDYGIGFRFGTAEGVMLRIDVAFGSADGKHYFIRFSNVF